MFFFDVYLLCLEATVSVSGFSLPGLSLSSPPQFLQTQLHSSAHAWQYVHSKEHIYAQEVSDNLSEQTRQFFFISSIFYASALANATAPVSPDY